MNRLVFAYLKRNDAAICVDNLSELESQLRKLLAHPNILIEYQKKAFELGKKNHLKEQNDYVIKQDFVDCLK